MRWRPRSGLFTENESSRSEIRRRRCYRRVNSRYVADVLKVRNAGEITCPPAGVTRKTANPR
jgi:hypothetical protein